jgi:hypothetical protein
MAVDLARSPRKLDGVVLEGMVGSEGIEPPTLSV